METFLEQFVTSTPKAALKAEFPLNHRLHVARPWTVIKNISA